MHDVRLQPTAVPARDVVRGKFGLQREGLYLRARICKLLYDELILVFILADLPQAVHILIKFADEILRDEDRKQLDAVQDLRHVGQRGQVKLCQREHRRAVLIHRQLLVRRAGKHAADPALIDRASRPHAARLKIGDFARDLALQLLNLFLQIRLHSRPFRLEF